MNCNCPEQYIMCHFVFSIPADTHARSTSRRFWDIQDIPEYKPTGNNYIGKVYFMFIKFVSQKSHKTITPHIRSYKPSDELQTDLYPEYMIMSKAKQQADADTIPSK